MIYQKATSHGKFFCSTLPFLLSVMVMLVLTSCQSKPAETATATKSTANETAAIGALRTISSAQSMYTATHEGSYGTFAQLVSAGNLDQRFSGEQPVIGGYVLTMKLTPKDSGGQAASFTVNADPQSSVAATSAGSRHFYLDSTENIIRFNAKGSASASDPTL